uniref:C-type lectin domain-containing protein n=1 Tax=Mastacembelus armatus TaxID=205130 RepID=A0A7N8XJQ4_9TELE
MGSEFQSLCLYCHYKKCNHVYVVIYFFCFNLFLMFLVSTRAAICPPGWLSFAGKFCYKPFEVKKTWHDARRACRALGAELVSILSMTEQSWLESYLYMGMDFETKRVNITLTGRWNDVSCTELNTYICKKPRAHYPVPSVKPTVYGCPQVGQVPTSYFMLLLLVIDHRLKHTS